MMREQEGIALWFPDLEPRTTLPFALGSAEFFECIFLLESLQFNGLKLIFPGSSKISGTIFHHA